MPREKKQHLKRRPDGRYACRYKGLWFYGDTSDQALRARDAYKKAEAAGLALRNEKTVQEYALTWLPIHKSGVSPKCYNDYATQLEKLFPLIGRKLLSEVTVDDAAAVWQTFSGMSASTIKRAKMLYVALFDTAIENELCRKNPFRSKFAAPPKGPAGSHRALTQEEIALILSTPHRMQLPVLIMLYAGLRRGELLALDMSDIDLKKNLIHVTKAVRFLSNQPQVVSPKTDAGTRSVPILSPLRPFLQNRVGLICPAVSGKMMSDTAFSRAWDSWLHTLSLAAGHPVEIRAHDLRHTYCTLLRDAGVDMKQAMIWLGHADEKMILRVYDHVGASRTRASISRVESLIGSQNGSQRNAAEL